MNFITKLFFSCCFFYITKPLDDKQMHLIAKQLNVSVLDLKQYVPCWSKIRIEKSLISAYKKKILKYYNYGKGDYCDYDIVSIYDILPQHAEILYLKCDDAYHFKYDPFPISKFPDLQPHSGKMTETFVLRIPHGKVFSENGYVCIDDNKILLESMPTDLDQEWQKSLLPKCNLKNGKRVPGKVAIITANWPFCYFHWMTEVLAKLYLLKKMNIEYDWLYVPLKATFMKESLLLYGVDLAKIIEPLRDNQYIQADELIVPSYPCRQDIDQAAIKGRLTSFVKKEVIDDLQKAFLPLIINKPTSFCKKVFISRQDSKARSMLNEDDVFAVFEKQGFEHYCLSRLSFLEQISLFHNAEIIVGAHGAGLVNMLFCKPQTKIIEIFQARSDCTYFYLAQQLGLSYQYIKTQDFDGNDFQGFKDTIIDTKTIDDFCSKFFGGITD